MTNRTRADERAGGLPVLAEDLLPSLRAVLDLAPVETVATMLNAVFDTLEHMSADELAERLTPLVGAMAVDGKRRAGY